MIFICIFVVNRNGFEPYTYTQLIDGIDGNVTIYNLEKTSLHKYLTTNIVEQ